MVRTCNIRNYNSNKYKTIIITNNSYSKFVEKLFFMSKDKINNLTDAEKNSFYIEQYYEQVLSKLDPEEVYKDLNNNILLYDDEGIDIPCVHIIAEWIDLLLNINIPEIKVKDNEILEIERPKYIKECLENVMRKNRDMRGFNSLRSLYLFEKGEILYQKATQLDLDDKYYDHLRQEAWFLKSLAEDIEDCYNQQLLKKHR